MITVLCVDAVGPYQSPPSPVLVLPVAVDSDSWARAGNIEVLSRYNGVPTRGLAYYLVLDEDGYRSSNAFFQYADTDGGSASLVIPPSLYESVVRAIEDLIRLSAAKTIVLIAEENGHVTDTDLSYPEMESIGRFGPLDLAEFWGLIERRAVCEDSLVLVTAD